MNQSTIASVLSPLVVAWGMSTPGFGIDVNEVNPGDRICIIGNTLADRMQHDGWLEARIQAAFPRHNLVIRNLGYSADEVTVHFRSANFGSRDDHLALQSSRHYPRDVRLQRIVCG